MTKQKGDVDVDTNAPSTAIGSGYSPISKGRVEKAIPDYYRLARRPSGEIILQGSYTWQEGQNYGHEWRDIPTVEI